MPDYPTDPIRLTLGNGPQGGRLDFPDLNSGRLDLTAWRHRAPGYRSLGTLAADTTGRGVVTLIEDGQHNAFPSVRRLASGPNAGRLVAMYRAGADHVDNTGRIVMQTSDTLGRTWSAATVVYDHPTLDVRDPSLRILANGTWIVSYFLYDASSANEADWYAVSANIIRSTDGGATWGAPVNVGGGFTKATGVSDGVLQLANGTLLLAVYGLNTGDTLYTSKVVRSLDGGDTWATLATIATGTRSWEEPSLLLRADGSIYAAIRSNPDTYASTSADSGATWTAAARAFTGEGSTYQMRLTDGRHLILYRSGLVTGKPIGMRLSTDAGATWSREIALEARTTPTGQMTVYAEAVEVGEGVLCVVYGYQNGADAGIYCTYVLTGYAESPLGEMAVPQVSAGSLNVLGGRATIGTPSSTAWGADDTVRALVIQPGRGDPAGATGRLYLGGNTETAGGILGGLFYGHTEEGSGLSGYLLGKRGSQRTYLNHEIWTRGPNGLICALRIEERGRVVIGGTTSGAVDNGSNLRGLTINQQGDDGECLSLKSSDVAHGMTALTETDTYLHLGKIEGGFGGLLERAYRSGGTIPTAHLSTVHTLGTASTNRTTAARAVVEVYASRIATGTVANLSGAENVWAVRCRKGGADVTLCLLTEAGDVILTTPGAGTISTSPDGLTRQRIHIANGGGVTSTTV